MTDYWPEGWPRTEPHKRQRGEFGKQVQRYAQDGTPTYKAKAGLPWTDAVKRVQDEVRRMRGAGLTITTQPGDSDPGVVVAFRLPGDKPVVFPCDRYTVKGQNLAAIAATLEAKRAIERHGVSTLEREFAGYAALPASIILPTRTPPHVVLGVQEDAPREVIDAAYKARVLKTHPDRGGDAQAFQEVQDAYRSMTA